MISIPYITYTHSEYSIIWDVVIEQVVSLYKPYMPIYVFIDKGADTTKFTNAGFIVIEYDPELSYPQKMLQCLKHINTDYIMFVHDVFLSMTYDNTIFQSLFNYVREHNIDRVDFYSNVNPNTPVHINNEISIIRNHNFFAYSVGPSLWKKISLIDIFEKFNTCSYRTIENQPTQDYVMSKFNIYNISRTSNMFTHNNHYFNRNISFAHIITHGKFMDTSNSTFNNILLNMYTKYNIPYTTWKNCIQRS